MGLKTGAMKTRFMAVFRMVRRTHGGHAPAGGSFA
jgi:hypothetical protein